MTSSTQAYGEPWYWDNRYTNEPGPFDWYQKYITLAPIINLYVPPTQRILIVGCGNSGTFSSRCSFYLFVFYSDLIHGYMPLSLDSRKITFL